MRHMKENEKLDTFKSVFLGNYILKSYNKKNPFGSFYLDNINNWNDLKNKNIYLNILDENFETPLQKLKQVLIENFLKKNFIILRFESDTSSVAFYINNLPNMVDNEFSIAQILINDTDFIDSKGLPDFNKSYNLVYILNDPSKEVNIVKTPTTKLPSSTSNVFSLDTKVKIPVGKIVPEKKYAPNPDIPPGVANFSKAPSIKKYNDALVKEESLVQNIIITKNNLRYDRIIMVILIILFVIFLIYMYQTQKAPETSCEPVIIITTTEYGLTPEYFNNYKMNNFNR